MSIRVMSIVYAATLGSAVRKAVALKLADCAADDGTNVYPSLKRVARETEVSRSTVQRSIRELIEMKILVLVERGGAGQGDTTEYKFDMQVLSKVRTVTTLEDSPKVVTQSVKVVRETQQGTQGDHRSINQPLEPSDIGFLKVVSDKKKTPAKLDRFVSEDALDRVRAIAAGWDRQALLRRYLAWDGSKAAVDLDAAFIAWVKKITGGKPPGGSPHTRVFLDRAAKD